MSNPARAPGDFASVADGRRDFDFLMGRWNVRHRRLRTLLADADDWYEFPGACVAQPMLNGLGNVEEHDLPTEGFKGMAVRLFDPTQQHWAIYWANSLTGILFPPVFGCFENGEGRFHGEDACNGKPVQVTYLWSRIAPATCRWEQAFSLNGQDWETNWIMEFQRA